MSDDEKKNNVLSFNKNWNYEEKLDTAKKIQIINNLANDGVISNRQRLNIVKKIINKQ